MATPIQLQEIKKQAQTFDLIGFHYLFCRKFGWIPPEEFRKLKIPAFFNLLNKIYEEYEAEKSEYKKLKHKRRF